MSADRDSLIEFALSEDDVKCIAGVVAQLEIAVKETKVIELDVERRDRLEQARHVVNKWLKVVSLRQDLRRAEAEAKRV